MNQVFRGKYRKITEAVVIIAGLYLLFSIFLVILDPPYIVPVIAGMFVLYCVWGLPAADRRLAGGKRLPVRTMGEKP